MKSYHQFGTIMSGGSGRSACRNGEGRGFIDPCGRHRQLLKCIVHKMKTVIHGPSEPLFAADVPLSRRVTHSKPLLA